MPSKMSLLATVVAAGALTTGIAGPSAAAAATNANCKQPSPSVTVCSSPGSNYLNARPNPTTAPNSSMNGRLSNPMLYDEG